MDSVSSWETLRAEVGDLERQLERFRESFREARRLADANEEIEEIEEEEEGEEEEEYEVVEEEEEDDDDEDDEDDEDEEVEDDDEDEDEDEDEEEEEEQQEEDAEARASTRPDIRDLPWRPLPIPPALRAMIMLAESAPTPPPQPSPSPSQPARTPINWSSMSLDQIEQHMLGRLFSSVPYHSSSPPPLALPPPMSTSKKPFRPCYGASCPVGCTLDRHDVMEEERVRRIQTGMDRWRGRSVMEPRVYVDYLRRGMADQYGYGRVQLDGVSGTRDWNVNANGNGNGCGSGSERHSLWLERWVDISSSSS